MKHHVRIWKTSNAVLRTDAYGNRKPSSGTLEAVCQKDGCGWKLEMKHNGTDREEVNALLEVAVHGHVDGANLMDGGYAANTMTPNAGHPMFQPIRKVPVRYHEKPPVYEAMQWNGERDDESVREFLGEFFFQNAIMPTARSIYIPVSGWSAVMAGDWIVKGIAGDVEVVSDEYFQKRFEKEPGQARKFEYRVC